MSAPTKTGHHRLSRHPKQGSTARRPGAPYRTARWLGLGVVIALVVAIAVVAARGSDDHPAPRVNLGEVVAPANLAPSGWISLGSGPVTVAVYFDYLCPACGAFEAANGDELERLLEAGAITLELRPIAFLDHLSAGTEYSTRSASALATVVDAEPEHAWAFHRALYDYQPEEGGEGLTDHQLAAIAIDAGVPRDVAARFEETRFRAWTAARTKRAFAEGVEGTPTILLDGQVFEGDPYATGPLTVAIEQAAP